MLALNAAEDKNIQYRWHMKKEAICDGVHIMAIGREEVVPDILVAAGI